VFCCVPIAMQSYTIPNAFSSNDGKPDRLEESVFLKLPGITGQHFLDLGDNLLN